MYLTSKNLQDNAENGNKRPNLATTKKSTIVTFFMFCLQTIFALLIEQKKQQKTCKIYHEGHIFFQMAPSTETRPQSKVYEMLAIK